MSKLLSLLPPTANFKTVEILEKIIAVNQVLSLLDKEIVTIPNYKLLLEPLTAREAVASSEIENIYTTTLELLQAELMETTTLPSSQKEVLNYKKALLIGYQDLINEGKLDLSNLINIHTGVVPNKIGLRKRPGTVIGNRLGEVIYRPPQSYQEILGYTDNLFEFINSEVDPLLKIIISHYQFEAIHPFYDGNGRVGRILMSLMLCQEKKLQYPVLYVSGYILKNKATYYELFREIQTKNNWQDWIHFHLNGIKTQAEETLLRIQEINKIRLDFVTHLKTLIYNKKLDNNLQEYFFARAFYTQTNMAKILQINRNTAKKYLEILYQAKLLTTRKAGKELLYFIPEFLESLS